MNEELDKLEPIKSEQLNLKIFHNKPTVIVRATVMQVPSRYTPLVEGSTTERVKQWVLKVESDVVSTLKIADKTIEFRASELFNLVQTDQGVLAGYPQEEKSNLAKFMKDIGATKPSDIVGKSATIKAYDRTREGEGTRTFLKFKY